MARRARDLDKDDGRKDGHVELTENVFREHYEACLAARNDLETATGVYRATLKAAKGAGINTRQLTRCIDARKADKDALRVNENDWRKYAAWLGLPIGTQTEMQLAPAPRKPTAAADPVKGNGNGKGHGGEPSEDEMRAANHAGAQAGLDGKDISTNPHEKHTPPWEAWNAGWKTEQEKAARRAFGGKKKNGGEERAPI